MKKTCIILFLFIFFQIPALGAHGRVAKRHQVKSFCQSFSAGIEYWHSVSAGLDSLTSDYAIISDFALV